MSRGLEPKRVRVLYLDVFRVAFVFHLVEPRLARYELITQGCRQCMSRDEQLNPCYY
jgi:hypothetical protein